MKIPRANTSSYRNANHQVTSDLTSFSTNLFSASTAIVQKYKEEKDNSDIQDAQNKRLKELNNWRAENYSREGEKALGVTKDYEEKIKEINLNLTGSMSPNARKKFEGWATGEDEKERLRVMMFEQGEDNRVKHSRFNEGLTLSNELIRVNAKSYDDAFTHLESTLENARSSGLIKEENFETERTKYLNQLRSETGKNYYTQDKHDFMKNINQMGFGQPEIEYYKQKYQNDIESAKRERQAKYSEEARLIFESKPDLEAQAIENADTSHFHKAIERLKEMGHDDKARAFERDAQVFDKVIGFNETHKNKTIFEKVQEAEKLEISDTELQGSGVSLESNNAIKRQTRKELEGYLKDPSGYVSKLAVGETPEQVAESRLSLQRKQGIIPTKGYQVLSANEANHYKKAYEAGDERQKRELIKEFTKYGKHAPKAISELGVNRSLTFTAFIDSDLDKEILINAATSKITSINPDLKDADIKNATLQSSLIESLSGVQSLFPNDSGLNEQINELTESMNNISKLTGKADGGAKFFEKHFNVEMSSDKNIFYPKSFDEDHIEEFLDSKKKTLVDTLAKPYEEKALASPGSIDQVRGNIQNHFRDQKYKQIQAQRAVNGYTWINFTGGFVLADSNTGRLVPGTQVYFDDIKKDK